MEHPPSGQFVQSLDRGLAVIRSFDAGNSAQTLSDVAKRTGLTRAAARRFLLTLETLGYVTSDGKHFQLSPRVLELGFSYFATLPFRTTAAQVLQRLSDGTGESCSMSVLDGHEIVYICRVHTRKIMRVNITVGTRFPARSTSMGRVLLSGLSETELDAVLLSSPAQPLTPKTLTDDDALRHELERVRDQGWAFVDQELELGLRSLAVPVLDDHGAIAAALNISMPSAYGEDDDAARASIEALVPRLQAAAAEISSISRLSPVE